MTIEEAKRRLKNISSHAIHTFGEEPFTMSLDDGIAIKTAIKSLEALQTISNLFSKWQNGEVDDNEYFFQMQNILLFGKMLEGEVSE